MQGQAIMHYFISLANRCLNVRCWFIYIACDPVVAHDRRLTFDRENLDNPADFVIDVVVAETKYSNG
ncbi:ADM_HP2_G0024860.mRNA.1.CDS.1 [Saccharomyces cerevisiae]|nr:ADM_HP2_G0024860.mRNA.1.CDS.1 [Saccharomyces cerevisiae]CAI6450932.1 ADM_HP2_G0024860.mRNA.1.CDS.1 [Saccharomyces cerevisiae]